MRLLLDEMFPPEAARRRRTDFSHDAIHVRGIGLAGTEDAHVAAVSRAEGWVLVTENVADFAREDGLVLVCVLKRNLPAGAAQAVALAELLDAWCRSNPRPYVGQHWPS